MEHLLNYKPFNIELLEPHLQKKKKMRRNSTESKTKTAKK